MEIVNRLAGEVSARFVRKCLDKKYKNRMRVKNANKQKRTLLKDKITIDKLAEQVPLNNKELVIVGTDGQSLVQRDGGQSSTENNTSIDDKRSPTLSTKSLVKKTQELEQQSTKHSETKRLEECPSCKELRSKNLELEVALKKSNQFNTANTIKNAPDREEKKPDIQDFVYWKTIKEIRDYILPLFPKLGDNGRIRFSVTIDKSAGKLISSIIGGTSLSNNETKED